MPTELIVNNIPFEYPIPGDSPGWGQPATDWATEVTLVLNELFGSTDILQTTFSIANDQSSSLDVEKMYFNPGLVRSALVEYSIYRTSTATPTGHSESGIINVTYDNLAGTGSKWSLISYGINGDSGVTFTITDLGQVQYQSTMLADSDNSYSGIIHFRAKTLNQ